MPGLRLRRPPVVRVDEPVRMPAAMNIISHRGYWTAPAEKNQEVAFRRALGLGFGIETDIRDLAGDLVISHDPAPAGAMPYSRFMALYLGYGDKGPLAINVK